jgi:GTP:adenosylcobinamide-phosphate guanylyltransferase
MQEMNNNKRLPSFSEPIDAIVLAGTHGDPSRLIHGKNKAFLTVDGRPLLRHVIDALLGARSIAGIFVVGPVDQMSEALPGVPERVQLVEQQGNILGNGWAGVHASEEQKNGARDPMRPLLAISSDLPLVSSIALDDFVARCADDEQASNSAYGLMIGLADEAGLAPFAEAGIVRPYVELEFARVRLANIYIARPWALSNLQFLQTGFGFRKAVNWKNVLGLTFSFLSQQGGWQAAWLTLRLQATLLAARRRGRLYRRLRRWNTRERVEARTSKVLGGPVRLVVSPFGGLSMDVDDEEDLRKLAGRYDEWMAIHNAAKSEYLPGRSDADLPG